MSIAPLLGRPGVPADVTASWNFVARSGTLACYAGGGTIEGTKARDAGNTDTIRLLRVGKLMGKITASGYYANSIIGKSTGAITASGTTLASSAAIATELVRRIGATGTFKLTGPPSAAGTVRTLTATYSAVNTTTGDITITALGVNEVQTVNLVTAATAGSLRLLVPKPDGTMALTPAIAWSATDATLLSNANTALDTATGVAGGLVATAIPATDTDLGFVVTFAGTGYAGLTGPTTGGSWPLIEVHTLFTSNTGANVVRTTSGVTGAFVTDSLIQPTDGSETILTFVPDGYGIMIPEDGSDVPFPAIPYAGVLDASRLMDYPADASTRIWIKEALSTLRRGKFVFDEF